MQHTHAHTHTKTHKDKMSSKNVKSGYLWEIGAAIFCNMLYLVLYTVCIYSRKKYTNLHKSNCSVVKQLTI